MQQQDTHNPQTPPLTRSEYAAQPPVRRVLKTVDWLRVVSAAVEERRETLRAALGVRA